MHTHTHTHTHHSVLDTESHCVIVMTITELFTYLLTHLLTTWSRVLLEKQPVFSWSRNSPHFTETKSSLPYSQDPATSPCFEPARPSTYRQNQFLKIYLNIIFPYLMIITILKVQFTPNICKGTVVVACIITNNWHQSNTNSHNSATLTIRPYGLWKLNCLWRTPIVIGYINSSDVIQQLSVNFPTAVHAYCDKRCTMTFHYMMRTKHLC